MRRSSSYAILLLFAGHPLVGQDTFSIVAVDTITGEVGSAGASCVDLFTFGITDIGFLGDLLPGLGAINTQAAYNEVNQQNARARMLAGDDPAEIIAWLQANDADGVVDANNRQYGVVGSDGTGAQSAAHTGSACIAYAGHRVGPGYSIQGNILLGPQILDSMETRFLGSAGSLAQKLMSALQGANVVGADTRCDDNNSSSLFAFLKISATGDPDGDPYLSLGVRTHDGAGLEPIDSLQTLFDQWVGISGIEAGQAVVLFPNPAGSEVTIAIDDPSLLEGIWVVRDDAGRTVDVDHKPLGSLVRLDIAALDPGLYLLSITSHQGARLLGRFIKQ